MIQLSINIPIKTTVKEVLEKHFPDVGSTKLKKFYTQNRIMRNGFLCKKDTPLKSQEKITILKKPKFYDDLLIYYEDMDIIVIEKPPQILSVDSEVAPGDSLHSFLKKRYGPIFPVHRLDRETTGVMVFTRNRTAKDSLKDQFKKKEVKREYLAICNHQIPSDKGVWDFPIIEGKDKKMRVSSKGKKSITHYQVLKRLKSKESYIKCVLETGRKNQIRIHASHAGFSLVGDRRYGTKDKSKRLFLHAHTLSFSHPKKQVKMSFISPIPRDFQKKVL